MKNCIVFVGVFMSIFRSLILLCLVFGFINCASESGGTSTGSTGAAGLSIQLKENSSFTTNNGFTLTPTTFAMSFSQLSLSSFSTDESFAADFFDEEAADIIEIENVSGGEYEEIELTFSPAEGLGGDAAFLISNVSVGDEVTESLNDYSFLLVASATDGNDSCQVRILLNFEETITISGEEGVHVEITPNEEAEILVEVDPDAILSSIDLEGCQDNQTMTISEGALANQLISNLGNALSLESADDHGHDH